MNKTMKILIGCLFVVFLSACGHVNRAENMEKQHSIKHEVATKKTKKLQIVINGTKYEITLHNNATTNELCKRLPVSITMQELHGNEKYYYFKDKLPSEEIKPGDIKAGDVMLFGSDCLVVFYKNFHTSYGYTPIGRINNPGDLQQKLGKGNVDAGIAVEEE